MEAARPEAGQLSLRVCDDRVAQADVRPGARVDVQGEEPADLRRRGVQVAIAGHHDPRRVVLLVHLCHSAAPVAVHPED